MRRRLPALVALAIALVSCGRPPRPATNDPERARCMRTCEDAESYCRGMWFYTQGDGSEWPLLLVGGFIGAMMTSCSRDLDVCYRSCVDTEPGKS